MVVLQVLSIVFESQRMVVVMLVLPKGIENQMMVTMMNQTELYTHNWCCDYSDVVVVSLRWYW